MVSVDTEGEIALIEVSIDPGEKSRSHNLNLIPNLGKDNQTIILSLTSLTQKDTTSTRHLQVFGTGTVWID